MEKTIDRPSKISGRGGKFAALSIVGGLWVLGTLGTVVEHSATVTASVTQSSKYRKLQKAALTILHDRYFGLGGLCDKIYDDQLRDITHGTLTDPQGKTARFPGMVAQVDYMCVNAFTGDREKTKTFWVILGYDDVTDRYRCLKFAGRPVIEDLMNQCNFKPGSS